MSKDSSNRGKRDSNSTVLNQNLKMTFLILNSRVNMARNNRPISLDIEEL